MIVAEEELEFLFKSSFDVALIKPWPAQSFECLELVLYGACVASTLRICIIYRRPLSGRHSKPLSMFLKEFGELLEHVCIQKTGFIILGDFDVHYRSSTDNDAC